MPVSNKDEYQRIQKAAELLAYLNIARVRCTYKAFGELLGVPARSVSCYLGERRREASWVVNSSSFKPTDYNASQKHPNLTHRKYKLSTGKVLEWRMSEGWGVSEEGIEEWRGILARELLTYLSNSCRFCTQSAFGEVLGVSASLTRLYLKEGDGKTSRVISKCAEQEKELRHAHDHSQSSMQHNLIESGIELERLMRDNAGAQSIRDMPISPKFNWWQTEDI